MGPRENRYGVLGDNGYGKTVEIKKRPAAVMGKPKAEPGVKLSKEGVIEVF